MSMKLSEGIKFENSGMFGNHATPVILIKAKNTSGGTLARGDVVVWNYSGGDASTADMVSATTTTSAAVQTVMGMVSHSTHGGNADTVADNTMMWVQIFGPTNALKVDGTTDIAIGDVLVTFTTAKIAKKGGSASGGIFARALEAYATNDSAGVIDAFISCLVPGGKTEV